MDNCEGICYCNIFVIFVTIIIVFPRVTNMANSIDLFQTRQAIYIAYDNVWSIFQPVPRINGNVVFEKNAQGSMDSKETLSNSQFSKQQGKLVSKVKIRQVVSLGHVTTKLEHLVTTGTTDKYSEEAVKELEHEVYQP